MYLAIYDRYNFNKNLKLLIINTASNLASRTAVNYIASNIIKNSINQQTNQESDFIIFCIFCVILMRFM